MSQQDFEALRPAIEALDPDTVKEPNLPVHVAVQEAEDLYHWCQPDQEVLVKAGLDWQLVEDLPARAGACRYAQAIWRRDSQVTRDAQKEWKERSKEAFDLRDVLIHHFYHAFRKNPDLINKVRDIDEGGSNSDMIQDLKDLYHLGIANKELLDAISFDWSELDKARDWSDELADVLARANGEKYASSESKIMRDRAYTYLKQAMDEIRTHGQYVFWRNPERKRGYVSGYWK
ncbi:hypothetical protein ACT29H_06510 [Thermophagus sp. OGC60D27]|uniref:hypothetical protein n=1 Tax=Thermophagus sp. OGC60D27 TaxID=3458415 RepID=UPI0040381498